MFLAVGWLKKDQCSGCAKIRAYYIDKEADFERWDEHRMCCNLLNLLLPRDDGCNNNKNKKENK